MNNTTPRQPVLIVCHADGWIEAYADRNVDVHIVQKPATDSPEGRIKSEAYLDVTLPYRYRGLYWPGKRRAADLVREVRPSDLAARDWQMELIATLNRIQNVPEKKRGHTWIA